jgi:drug/metabolite transporter (DMT)-like permease
VGSPSPTAFKQSVDRPGFAIGLVLVVMFIFMVMDSISKLLTQTAMAPEAITMIRYGIVLTVLVPVIAYRWKDRPLATKRPFLQAIRGVFLITTATAFVYALKYLPLETATAIAFMSPLYVTILSIPFLGEKVGPRRWGAVILGFVGVLLIVRPGTDSFHWAMLLPIAGSVFWAGGLIIARAFRTSEQPLTVLIWSTGAGFLVVLPFGLSAVEMPNAEQWMFLLALGFCHLTAQYLMIRAYMLASASLLAPFSYTTLIWAIMFGIFVFGSYPDVLTVVGAVVLAGAGLYVWHRERTVAGQ